MFDWLVALLGPTPYDALTNPHPFPMVRTGGLFLICLGIGTVIGAFRDALFLRIIGLGLALNIGGILYNALTLDLVYTIGTPTDFQNWTLPLAVNLVAIGWGVWSLFVLRQEGVSRRYMAGLMIILALGLLVLAPAQGWVLVLVALASIAWTLWALRGTALSINRAWLVNGLLKIVGGLVLVIFYPA